MSKPLLDKEQAAARLDVSVDEIARLIRNGRLPTVKSGGPHNISRYAVKKLKRTLGGST